MDGMGKLKCGARTVSTKNCYSHGFSAGDNDSSSTCGMFSLAVIGI